MINKEKTNKNWKGIKQLLHLKSEGSSLPGKLIINEQEITIDKATADQLLINSSLSLVLETTWP